MSKKEFNAGKVSDLKNGEMKEVKVDEDNKILLTKVNDKISALGAKCTHYGASLVEGALSGNTIVCPWHHACFNAQTGDLLEPPAHDSIPQYEVKINNENIIVMLPEKLESNRLPKMSKRDPENINSNVIIGGGAAGNAAAQAMREAGYTGGITIITQENRTPYDRPNLSKDYLAGEAEEEWMPLRSKEFYEEYDINILFQEKVKGIDKEKKMVLLENGENIKFNKLLLASGSEPKKLKVPGADLNNIFYLRSHNDCDDIIEACSNASKIVVIGTSFIGLETASSLKKRLDKKAKITVVGKDEIPFKKILGKEIGNLIKSSHEENGINFKLKTSVKKFEGKDKVEKVILENNESIDADIVIIGIGVKPATSFFKGINLENNGDIKVNKYFEVEQNIYAAGDIAKFFNANTNSEMRIEHWRTALQQGRIAGFNMADKKIEYKRVPFFWTNQAGLSLQYVGHAEQWDNIITWGNISSKKFISFYYKDETFLAAAAMEYDKELAALEALIKSDKVPPKEKIKNESVKLADLLN